VRPTRHPGGPVPPAGPVTLTLTIDAQSAGRLADLIRGAIEAAVATPGGSPGSVSPPRSATDQPPDEACLLIDIKDLARLLAVSPRHVFQLNKQQLLPEPVRLGRLVRWSLAEVRAWVAAGCPPRREWAERLRPAGAGQTRTKATCRSSVVGPDLANESALGAPGGGNEAGRPTACPSGITPIVGATMRPRTTACGGPRMATAS
jgi:predicted DNA-binding transcriptional regulator AlpA